MINNLVKITLVSPVQGVLDVTADAEVPLTFSIGDVRDISKKQGTFSKTIKLAGTKNNNLLLNNYFEVNIEEGTFNINTKQKCQIVQNGVVILENGVLQLISVKKMQKSINGEDFVEYEALIKDDVGDLFTIINQRELTDIEFGDYDHFLNAANIIATLNNDANDNYKYFFPYKENSIEYYLADFKPAIFAKVYWDRIFEGAGFTYQWDTLSADTVQFNNLLIPYNGPSSNVPQADIDAVTVIAERTGTTVYTAITTSPLDNTGEIIIYNNIIQNPLGPDSLYLTLSQQYNNQEYYLDNESGANLVFNFVIEYDIEIKNNESNVVYLVSDVTSTALSGIRITPELKLYKLNPQQFLSNWSMNQDENDFLMFEYSPVNTPPTSTIAANQSLYFSGNTWQESVFTTLPIAPGFDFNTRLNTRIEQLVSTAQVQWRNGTSPINSLADVEYRLVVKSIKVNIVPRFTSLGYNNIVRMNQFIPQKVKQSDFVKAIMTMYNLYVITDPEIPNKLIFKHRDEYYDQGIVVDWSKKLAKNLEQDIKFLPDLNARSTIMTYKQDDNDPFMKIYRDGVKEIYGQVEYTFDQNEYLKGVETKEMIFSPICVVDNINGDVLPVLDNRSPKTNIKIALNAKQQISNNQYAVYDYSGVNFDSQVTNTDIIPLISHFNDSYEPTFDINFGINDYYGYRLNEITNNNLFNLHWRRTFSQLENGKMLTAWFYLTENDIKNLQLNQRIYVMDSYWFINQIIDYKSGQKELTKVELISVEDELKQIPFLVNGQGGTNVSQLAIVKDDFSQSVRTTTNVQGNGNSTVNGFGNFVEGNGVVVGVKNVAIGDSSLIVGDNNFSNSRKSIVLGSDNYNVGNNSLVVGNNITGSTDNSIATQNLIVTETINGITATDLGLFISGTGDKSIIANNDTGNIASGDYSFAIGEGNVASGNYSHAEGRGTDALGTFSYAGGFFTTANNYNEWARGQVIASNTVGQYGYMNLVERTTNATPTDLTLDSGTQYLSIASGSVYHIAVTLVAQNSSGDTYVSKWDGVIKNVSGTTSIVGTPTTSLIAADTAMTGVSYTVSADDSIDAFVIEVTGLASTTINWNAVCQYSAIKIN